MDDFDHGKRAVDALAKDAAAMAYALIGKTPEEINLDAVLEYLELLKSETERVKDGIYAKDNSILYTSGGKISFDKVPTK